MLQDLKTSTTDREKRRLQRRMELAERLTQDYKGRVSEYESDATGHEKILGLLEKKGECRTWQCSCE